MITACLGVVNDGHVAEILREAGPQVCATVTFSFVSGSMPVNCRDCT